MIRQDIIKFKDAVPEISTPTVTQNTCQVSEIKSTSLESLSSLGNSNMETGLVVKSQTLPDEGSTGETSDVGKPDGEIISNDSSKEKKCRI